jgi:hypothetical protein
MPLDVEGTIDDRTLVAIVEGIRIKTVRNYRSLAVGACEVTLQNREGDLPYVGARM